MKKIGTIGSATQDIFILYEGADTLQFRTKKGPTSYMMIKQGTKIDVPKLHYATGGASTNTAVSLKRLGLEAEAFFKVGDDSPGKFILQEMAQERVNTSHCIIDSSKDTALSFILPSIEKNHVAFCYRGANRTITKHELPAAFIASLDALFLNSLSGTSKELVSKAVSLAHDREIPIAFNPGPSQLSDNLDALIPILKQVDILIVNAYEASLLMKSLLQDTHLKIKKRKVLCNGPHLFEQFLTSKDVELTICDYFKEIHKLGPSIAVVTNGIEGVYVSLKKNMYFHPSIPTSKAVTGLGAGDAFSSAFVGYLIQKKPLEEAILAGVLNATSVVEGLDAKQGLLTKKELDKKMKAHGLKQIISCRG